MAKKTFQILMLMVMVLAAFAGTFFSIDFSDFSSAMAKYYSFALVTPTVLRGPLRVRAFVLVR